MRIKLAMVGAVFLTLPLLSSAGEDSAKKLVGVWQSTEQSGKEIPESQAMVLEFKADGWYSMKDMGGWYSKDMGKTEQGVYTVKDKDLTLSHNHVVGIQQLSANELHLSIPRKEYQRNLLVKFKRVKK